MGERLAIHRQSLAMPISVLITDRTGIGPVPVAISSRLTILQVKSVLCRMGFGPAVEPQHMTVRVCDYKLADNLVLGKVYVPGEVLVITTPGDAMKKPGDVNPLWKKYGVAVSRVPLGVTVAEDKTGTGIAKELVDAMKQRVDLPPSKIKHYSRDGAAPAVAARRGVEAAANVENAAAGKEDELVLANDCCSHNMHDGVQAGVRAHYPAAKSNKTTKPCVPELALEDAADFQRANRDALKVEGIHVVDYTNDCRWGSNLKVAGYYGTYHECIKERLLEVFGKAPTSKKAAKLLWVVSAPEAILTWKIWRDFSYAVVQPFLRQVTTYRGHRFDRLATIAMDLVATYAAVDADPSATKLFRSGYAWAQFNGVDAAVVTGEIKSLNKEIFGYVFGRMGFIADLPWSLSFLFDDRLGPHYARALKERLWGSGAGKGEEERTRLVDVLGLRDDREIQKEVEQRAFGNPLSYGLGRRLAKMFAGYLLSQAQSEHDVKIVKDIVRGYYTRARNMIVRFSLLSSENEWEEVVLDKVKDDDKILRQLRKAIRDLHAEEAAARKTAAAAATHRSTDADVDELAAIAVGVVAKGSAATGAAARKRGLLDETQQTVQQKINAAVGAGRLGGGVGEGPCPCCDLANPPACQFATADGKPSCGCSLCYKCAKIVAMSQRSTGAPTPSYHCYVCAAPCAGLLVPDATAATPRFETFDHPLNPHRTCSCCNSHHLTTDAKSHTKAKCPLNSDKENPNPTKRHKPAAVAPTPFANLGECVRDSNTTAYSGERVAVGVPIVASL